MINAHFWNKMSRPSFRYNAKPNADYFYQIKYRIINVTHEIYLSAQGTLNSVVRYINDRHPSQHEYDFWMEIHTRAVVYGQVLLRNSFIDG